MTVQSPLATIAPDDYAAHFLARRARREAVGTVEVAQEAARDAERARFAGRPLCDWCDDPATLLVCDTDGSEDFACAADFEKWFAPAIAGGDTFDIVRL